MTDHASSDLRLVSVWHGDDANRSLHFSLYNTGPGPVALSTLNMTGGFWLPPAAKVRGARREYALSNYTVLAPEAAMKLGPDEVWTFSIADLNARPFRSGDGLLAADVVADDGATQPVAVQPLARSLDVGRLDAVAPHRRPGGNVTRDGAQTIAVIPFPNLTTVSGAPLSEPGPVFVLQTEVPGIDALAIRVDDMAAGSGNTEGPVFAQPGDTAGRNLVMRKGTDPRLGKEGYCLTFAADDVILVACGPDGFRHGLITLAQTVTGDRVDGLRYGLPVGGTSSDAPRFGWRGLHLDVARTFYTVDEIMALADLAAWLKLNVLHLHLNDDEGWRIGVDGYPEIAAFAAWRGHDLPIPPLLGRGAAPYGGVYDDHDIDRLHAFCTIIGITILPEIDIPGYGHAALTALTAPPRLREPDDTSGYTSIQGFVANARNPMMPQTLDFMNATFKTLLDRFPGRAIHIGGDDVGPATWSGSPQARAAIASGQLTGSLQARLIEPVHDVLRRNGRRTVVWEDAVHNTHLDPKDTIAPVWQHPDQAQDLAARGFDVVLTPGNAYYPDMAHSDDGISTGGHWAGSVPLEKTYSFELGHGWPADRLPHLIGIHVCIWGEYMHDRRNFDDLVFPRIYAFAERAWIDPANRDYHGFLSRVRAFPTALRPLGCAD